jgi:hypothetical protein
MDMFSFNPRDLKDLIAFFEKAPVRFRYATADVLNELAFGNRREALSMIKSKMIVRNRGFVESSLVVNRARGNRPISNQFSEFGSLGKKRSTGFLEQEAGEVDKRTRVGSLFARGGSESKQIAPSMRLKAGRRIIHIDDLNITNAKDDNHRTIIYLQILSRKYKGQSFLLNRKYKKLRKGVYRFKGDKLSMVYNMDPKKKVPKQVKWLSGGHSVHISRTDMRNVWAAAVERQIKMMGKS